MALERDSPYGIRAPHLAKTPSHEAGPMPAEGAAIALCRLSGDLIQWRWARRMPMANGSSPSRDRIVRVARSQPGLFWLLPKLPLTAPSAREAYRPGFRDKAIEHILAMGNSQQRVLPPLNYGFRVWRPTRAFCVLMLRYGGGQKITIIS